jgi:hypothetical protein
LLLRALRSCCFVFYIWLNTNMAASANSVEHCLIKVFSARLNYQQNGLIIHDF